VSKPAKIAIVLIFMNFPSELCAFASLSDFVLIDK
jgi:hypothetical protein